MVGVAEIEYYIPDNRIDISECSDYIGIPSAQIKIFERIYKLKTIPIYEKNDPLSFISIPIQKLMNSFPNLDKDIGLIIYAHTSAILTSFGGSVPRDIQQKFGFTRAKSFGMTLNKCVSSIKALQIAEQYLLSSENAAEKVLILSGEICYSPSVRSIPNTSVAGDAAVAVLISKKNYKYEIIDTEVLVEGKYASGIWMTPREIAEYDASYIPTMKKFIEECLSKNNTTLSKISKIFPHSINIPSWKKVANALQYPFDKIYTDNVPITAHTLGADIYINLKDSENKQPCKEKSLSLMISVGLGANYGCVLLKHERVL